jgi:hypothetical protein
MTSATSTEHPATISNSGLEGPGTNSSGTARKFFPSPCPQHYLLILPSWLGAHGPGRLCRYSNRTRKAPGELARLCKEPFSYFSLDMTTHRMVSLVIFCLWEALEP